MASASLRWSTRAWVLVVGALACVGLGLGWLADASTTFWVAGGVAVLAAVVLGMARGEMFARDLPVAFVVGLCFAGWQGITAYDGDVGAGVALLALLTWPPAVRAVTRWVRGTAAHPDDAVSSLVHLSDLELGRAWRRSSAALDGTPAHRLAVVRLRAAYLDEMIRRHPDRLEAWLADGGRAAGGPDGSVVDPG